MILLLAAFSVPPAAGGTRVFVANSGHATVSVIDADQEKEIDVIEVGRAPVALALRHDPPLLAVANSGPSAVSFIDPVALAPVGEAIPVPRAPSALAFSDDGNRLFAGCDAARVVVTTDVDKRAVVGEPIPINGPPKRLLLSSDGSRLYVLEHAKPGGLAVVDLATRAVTARLPLDPFPTDMAMTPDGTRLFVASFDADTLTTIDLGSLQVADHQKFPTGNGLVIHPFRPLLYSMVSFDDQVVAFDYQEKKEVATIAVGEQPAYSAISPDGRFLYVVNSTDGNVMKVDTATNRALVRIAVGAEPSAAVAFAVPGWWSDHTVIVAVCGLAILMILGAALATRRRRRT